MRRITTAVAAVVLALAACGDDSDSGDGGTGEITRAGFEADGLAWPFEADTASVRCEPGGGSTDAVVVTVDGEDWAANGAAQGAGYPDVAEIQAPDPEIPGDVALVAITDVIAAGMERC